MLGDQLARAAFGNLAAMVDDDQGVAQALRLIHEMRGEEQRLAGRLELLQAFPDQMAGLRVEAGGRLVEKNDVGIVDQGPGQGQATLHTAGQRRNPGVGLAAQAGKFKQRGDARLDLGVGQTKIAAEDQQVFGAGEIGVEVVELRHDANTGAGRLRRRRDGMAVQLDAAAVRPGQAEAKTQRRRLAGAIRPEQAKTLAGRHLERQTGHHGVAGVVLV